MGSRRLREGLERLGGGSREPERKPESGLASLLELDVDSNRMSEARELPVDRIRPNPHQPRQRFDSASLEELAESIREQGVLQPITVTSSGDGYQIVAGERRWRAAVLARLERIPALVRDLSERDQRVVALMENLQREDLNEIDRARGLAELRSALAAQSPETTSHDLDEQVGQRLGLSGRAVRNFLGLLSLTESVQATIAEGRLTEKHGRAIRRLRDPELQRHVSETAMRLKLTGDETTALVRSLASDPGGPIEEIAWRVKAGEAPAVKERPAERLASTEPVRALVLLGRLAERIGELERAVEGTTLKLEREQVAETARALAARLEAVAERASAGRLGPF